MSHSAINQPVDGRLFPAHEDTATRHTSCLLSSRMSCVVHRISYTAHSLSYAKVSSPCQICPRHTIQQLIRLSFITLHDATRNITLRPRTSSTTSRTHLRPTAYKPSTHHLLHHLSFHINRTHPHTHSLSKLADLHEPTLGPVTLDPLISPSALHPSFTRVLAPIQPVHTVVHLSWRLIYPSCRASPSSNPSALALIAVVVCCLLACDTAVAQTRVNVTQQLGWYLNDNAVTPAGYDSLQTAGDIHCNPIQQYNQIPATGAPLLSFGTTYLGSLSTPFTAGPYAGQYPRARLGVYQIVNGNWTLLAATNGSSDIPLPYVATSYAPVEIVSSTGQLYIPSGASTVTLYPNTNYSICFSNDALDWAGGDAYMYYWPQDAGQINYALLNYDFTQPFPLVFPRFNSGRHVVDHVADLDERGGVAACQHHHSEHVRLVHGQLDILRIHHQLRQPDAALQPDTDVPFTAQRRRSTALLLHHLLSAAVRGHDIGPQGRPVPVCSYWSVYHIGERQLVPPGLYQRCERLVSAVLDLVHGGDRIVQRLALHTIGCIERVSIPRHSVLDVYQQQRTAIQRHRLDLLLGCRQ